MIKIHIPEHMDRREAILEMIRRGRMICFAQDVFVVPEPSLDVLRARRVVFEELGRGGSDFAEKALRESLAANDAAGAQSLDDAYAAGYQRVPEDSSELEALLPYLSVPLERWE